MYEMSNSRPIVPSGDPSNDRRCPTSRVGSVKSATGHVVVDRWATHGKYVSNDGTRIATWNVRGLARTGKLHIVEKELSRYKIKIAGIAETHWRGSGHFYTADSQIFFSGLEDGSPSGVAILVCKELKNAIIGYNAINQRIIYIQVNTTPCILNIVQVYAPTTDASDEEIDLFYACLESTISRISNREIVLILGDLNAKVGCTIENEHLRSVIGRFGIGTRNERGERLLQFCIDNNFSIANTAYKQYIRRLYTWTSPNKLVKNQIDYILIKSRWRASILTAKTLPGADCESDHQLLVCSFRTKLKAYKRRTFEQKLPHITNRVTFSDMLNMNIAASIVTNQSMDPNELWSEAKQAIITALRSTQPCPKTTKKQHWIEENSKVTEISSQNEEPDILIQEVHAAIRKLAHNKSPEIDLITGEVLQAMGDDGVKVVHNICNLIWKTRSWPREWTTSVIIPLHKKGTTTKCDNYRLIALLTHISKIMLHIIQSRLQPFTTWQIAPEQAGFVKGRGTREQILNLRQLIEKAREDYTPMYICVVDYVKAFDKVKWHKMWPILTRMGIPGHLVQLIKNLYKNSTAVVRIENCLSPECVIRKGVRQGCILSPLLYNLYSEHIMRTVLDGWDGGV
ncbi:craniofacial development protein 2-like protein [Lasius niger]|uniref:Craniofacial development protein 2-like protein n=1 Tax=Lasius niger TaxID=67767 RepID=A0A0J7NGC2_LASNI|nr:craniofacial development protein 2-like protein [Lasius niger]